MKLYIDLLKALDTAKLVKKQITVKGKNGMFTRMQWVDPNTGQPVKEASEHPNDEHHHKITSMPADQSHMMVSKYVADNRDKANMVAQATGMKRAEHMSENHLTQHLSSHIGSIPKQHLDPYLGTKEEPKAETTKPPFSFPNILVENPDMDEETAKRRMGYDVLTKAQMTSGTRMKDAKFRDSNESNPEIFEHRFSKLDPDKLPYHDLDSMYDYVMGDLTKDAVENHLSSDEKGIYVKLSNLDIESMNQDDTTFIMEMELHETPHEESQIGTLIREVTRKHGSPDFHVYNESLEMNPEFQGNGWASELYSKSEAMWKHLAGGHAVHVTLTANISVGVYAWARKGFDFSKKGELQKARKELVTFCRANNSNLDKALENSGFTSVMDLKHSWDFANLRDGGEYDLKSAAPSKYKENFEGTGHLGKVFMIGGKEHWAGEKFLNKNHITEKVSSGGI